MSDAAATPAGATFVALALFGDAVAVLDRIAGTLAWVSDAWCDALPSLAVGTKRAVLEHELPGLDDLFEAGVGVSRQARVGANGEWCVRGVRLDARRFALRLIDRREQSRAVQRQLDDREQLLFTSRVLSVGEMATTLAHELNQPIGATSNLLRGLRARLARRAALSTEEGAALDQSIEQVMFAARVIARIREFTHSHQPRFAAVDLVELLHASASLLDWDLQRAGARLALVLPKRPVSVRGDAVMLQQVVVNLMRNALDALRTDPPPDPLVTIELAEHAGACELQVRDNGCGLSDAATEKLFVPFASTKPSGTGTGLLICRSFVEQHQGRLWFSRNADRGATFHFSLPWADR